MLIIGWEPIIANFICHQLVRIVQTLLERSFIHATPCEWNKLSEYDSGRVLNNVMYTTIWMLTENN